MKRSMVINIRVIQLKDCERRMMSLERLILTAVLRKQTKTRPSSRPQTEAEKRLQKTVPQKSLDFAR